MKRYSVSILFVTIVLIGLIGFYAIFSVRAETFHKNIIETVQGDPKEIKDVTLYGQGFIDNFSSFITVNSSRVNIEPIDLTNLKDRMDAQNSNEYRRMQIIQEYKSFMRKQRYDRYYEDETMILTAHLNAKKVKLRYFDKVEEAEHSFTVPIPKEYIKYDYVNVEDIQVIGQKANIIIRGGKDNHSNIFVLTIHMQQKKMIEHHQLFSTKILKENEKTEDTFEIKFHNEDSNAAMYKPITIFDYDQRGPDIWLYSMDLESGITTKITLPEKVTNDTAMYSKEDKFYYVSDTVGILYEVDLKSKKVVPIIKSGQLKKATLSDLVVKDQQAYILINKDEVSLTKPTILKVDLRSKEILYSGDIMYDKFFKDQSKENDGFFGFQIVLDTVK